MKKTKSKETVSKDKSKNYKPIKTKFAQLLLDKGVTLTEISDGTGISYPVLIDLKRGKRKDFNTRTLSQIASYLNVETNDLIDLTHNEKKDQIKTDNKADGKKTDKKHKAGKKKIGKKVTTKGKVKKVHSKEANEK